MATIDITSSDKGYKYFEEKARGISKVLLKKESDLSITIRTKGRGGRGLGRFHEIREIFIDKDNHVFTGFKAGDRSGHFYQYAIIGRLQIPNEGETL